MTDDLKAGHRFIYDAVVQSVYDGDTVTLTVDLGFNSKRTDHKCRLFGIDAPEVRGKERPDGLISRDWLRDQLPIGTEVIIQSHRDKTGKYGRWLATIYKDGVNLNERMVGMNLAEVNFYGSK